MHQHVFPEKPARKPLPTSNALIGRNRNSLLVYTTTPDPLCYPDSTVLINELGLQTQEDLDEYEAAVFQIRFEEDWPEGALDFEHYCALHKHLFQDVYAWAGEIRTIRIHKGDTTFAYPENIVASLIPVFTELADSNYLVGMEASEFAKSAAHIISEINAVHPFREGNGRTQLAFLSMVVDHAGWPFNEDVLEPETVIPAMIESFHRSEEPLVRLIEQLIAK